MEVDGKFILRNVNKTKQERKSLRVVKEKEENKETTFCCFLQQQTLNTKLK
jgi:hypothetical protein